jgi:hypothetical protein
MISEIPSPEIPEMSLTIGEPSYHGVVKIIVRPKFPYRVPSIENILVVVCVDAEGKETPIAVLHGRHDIPSTHLIEVEASNEFHVEIAADDDVVIP